MQKILFICSQNKLRSPTAEAIFSGRPGIEAVSAGLNRDGVTPLSSEMIEWADIIFVMEKMHKNKLSAKFKSYLRQKRVICLEISDDYDYMDPVLVRLLEVSVSRHLLKL